MFYNSFSSVLLFSAISLCTVAVPQRCRHLTVNGETKRVCTYTEPSISILNPFDIMSIYGDDFDLSLLEPNEEIEERTKEDETGDTCGLRVGFETSARILGGRKAYKNEFPWMVGIQYKGDGDDNFNIRGGGSIVNKRWIVTAAHVFDSDYNHSRYKGILDTLDVEKISINISFDKIIPYPKYNRVSGSYQHDIALMHTTEDIKLYPEVTGVNSVCLSDETRKFKGLVTASGYGVEDNEGKQSNMLMTVNLVILDDNVCRRIFRRLFNRRIQICSGYLPGNKDTCSGDSGGPLIKFLNKRAYLVGIVSFGEYQNCGRKGSGAVYSKVSYYLNWINENTKV